ncbi:MAG: NUDIX domain-containing protein, partial [Pseudomonadota bacterium]
AFGRRASPVDGNIERVVARLRAIDQPLPGAKPAIKAAAAALTPQARPGDFAQAMMDLGATVCAPKRARCMLCPWTQACAGRRAGEPERLPVKAPKPKRPKRFGVAYWAVRPDGAVLLRRRPPKGLLGGMMEPPGSVWRDAHWTAEEARRAAPLRLEWIALPGVVRHVFTHFELELSVFAGKAPRFAPINDGVWATPDRFGDYALPSVMKKVVRHAIKKTA